MSVQKIKKAIKIYLKSQIILMIINTIIYWTVLSLLELRFAFLFALMTGILSVIPLFGTITSALIVFIFSFFDGSSFSEFHPVIEGAIFILVYILLNQVIDLLISPYILGRSVKISPIILVIVVLLGTSIFGIFGAILAVPLLILIKVFSAKEDN